jgi:hypothetical protein
MHDTKPRFKSTRLATGDKPKTLYEYWVSGHGYFPLDMLRYDAAWPADSEAAVKMDPGFRDFAGKSRRSVRLLSYKEPTVARWASFLWSVGTESLYPK